MPDRNRFQEPNNVVEVAQFLQALPAPTEAEIAQNKADLAAWEAKYGAMDPLQAVAGIFEEAMNESHGVTGWSVKRIPYTTEQFWNQIINWFGEDNIKIITLAGIQKGKEYLRGGTILVSPDGIEQFKKKYEEEAQTKKPQS